METKFTSQISRGGYWLTPYIIVIDDTHVRFEKRTKWLVNKCETSIKLNKVSCVTISPSLIGTDITIESFGEGTISVKNFSISDSKQIKKMIDDYEK